MKSGSSSALPLFGLILSLLSWNVGCTSCDRISGPSANHPPAIQAIKFQDSGQTVTPTVTVEEGTKLVIVIIAVDPDNDPLVYSASPLPDGASFDAVNGILNWTTQVGQTGSFDITFSVCDQPPPGKDQLCDSKPITVVVTEGVRVAVFPATATVFVGMSQQFTASVTGTGNLAVEWYVSPQVGYGTVAQATGLYTAPLTVPAPSTAIVQAVSVDDHTKFGTATVTIAYPPGPYVTSLSPSAVTAGSPGFTLTVTGGNYLAGDVVFFNGISLPTTLQDSSTLIGTVGGASVASSGDIPVCVGPSAGCVSNTVNFTVFAPPPSVPVLSSIIPSCIGAGSPTFTLRCLGGGFTSTSTIYFNSIPLTTSFVSDGEVRADVSGSFIASPGTVSVWVTTPAPGGGTSGSLPFTVYSPGDTKTLSGQVVDRETGAGVPYAFVQVEQGICSGNGPGQYLTTDTNGNFSIQVPQSAQSFTLTAGSVGYANFSVLDTGLGITSPVIISVVRNSNLSYRAVGNFNGSLGAITNPNPPADFTTCTTCGFNFTNCDEQVTMGIETRAMGYDDLASLNLSTLLGPSVKYATAVGTTSCSTMTTMNVSLPSNLLFPSGIEVYRGFRTPGVTNAYLNFNKNEYWVAQPVTPSTYTVFGLGVVAAAPIITQENNSSWGEPTASVGQLLNLMPVKGISFARGTAAGGGNVDGIGASFSIPSSFVGISVSNPPTTATVDLLALMGVDFVSNPYPQRLALAGLTATLNTLPIPPLPYVAPDNPQFAQPDARLVPTVLIGDLGPITNYHPYPQLAWTGIPLLGRPGHVSMSVDRSGYSGSIAGPLTFDKWLGLSDPDFTVIQTQNRTVSFSNPSNASVTANVAYSVVGATVTAPISDATGTFIETDRNVAWEVLSPASLPAVVQTLPSLPSYSPGVLPTSGTFYAWNAVMASSPGYSWDAAPDLRAVVNNNLLGLDTPSHGATNYSLVPFNIGGGRFLSPTYGERFSSSTTSVPVQVRVDAYNWDLLASPAVSGSLCVFSTNGGSYYPPGCPINVPLTAGEWAGSFTVPANAAGIELKFTPFDALGRQTGSSDVVDIRTQ